MVPLATPAAAASSRLVMDSPVPVRSMRSLSRSPLTTAYIVGGDSLTFTSRYESFIALNGDAASIPWAEQFVQRAE